MSVRITRMTIFQSISTHSCTGTLRNPFARTRRSASAVDHLVRGQLDEGIARSEAGITSRAAHRWWAMSSAA